jgi:HAE1 family hydrophobic/amphiphilic exporter-1
MLDFAGHASEPVGIGADADRFARTRIAVIGGLLTSRVLSLVYIPVVYTFVKDVGRFLSRHLSRLRSA